MFACVSVFFCLFIVSFGLIPLVFTPKIVVEPDDERMGGGKIA